MYGRMYAIFDNTLIPSIEIRTCMFLLWCIIVSGWVVNILSFGVACDRISSCQVKVGRQVRWFMLEYILNTPVIQNTYSTILREGNSLYIGRLD